MLQTFGPLLEAPPGELGVNALADAPSESASQPAASSSQRPVSGEKTFLLSVAQRAKATAAAGGLSLSTPGHNAIMTSLQAAAEDGCRHYKIMVRRGLRNQRTRDWLVPAGAKKGIARQKLSWLDVLRQKSEQAQQCRKPEPTPSQSAGPVSSSCQKDCRPFTDRMVNTSS